MRLKLKKRFCSSNFSLVYCIKKMMFIWASCTSNGSLLGKKKKRKKNVFVIFSIYISDNGMSPVDVWLMLWFYHVKVYVLFPQDESQDFYKRQQLRELAMLNSGLREDSPHPSGSVSPFGNSGMKRAKTGR